MLLDTSAYSALAMGNKEIVEILSKAKVLIMPLPALAEIKFGNLLGFRTEENDKKLHNFLSQTQVQVVCPDIRTAEIYSDLATYSRRLGRSVGNNDLWIAALAKQHEVQLVTYDKDFEVFKDIIKTGVQILRSSH